MMKNVLKWLLIFTVVITIQRDYTVDNVKLVDFTIDGDMYTGVTINDMLDTVDDAVMDDIDM